MVSDRLGHADVAFTLSVYTHLYDDQRRAAAIPLHQLLSAKPSESQPAGQRDKLVAQLQQSIGVQLKGTAVVHRLSSASGWAPVVLSVFVNT